jgi:hypothetical protein
MILIRISITWGVTRVEMTRKDTASKKRPRNEKTKAHRKSKNMIQPEVERYHKNANDPESNSQVHYINETRISEIPDNLILGNTLFSNE